jgi:hypothetical protein
MSTGPSTIYVVHGWKVEGRLMEQCLMNLAPAVIELGLRLVFPKNEKVAFFGQILARTENEEPLTWIRVVPPAQEASTRIMKALEIAGLKPEEVGVPLLWVVAG